MAEESIDDTLGEGLGGPGRLPLVDLCAKMRREGGAERERGRERGPREGEGKREEERGKEEEKKREKEKGKDDGREMSAAGR